MEKMIFFSGYFILGNCRVFLIVFLLNVLIIILVNLYKNMDMNSKFGR